MKNGIFISKIIMLLPVMFSILLLGITDRSMASNCLVKGNILHKAGMPALGGGAPIGLSVIIILALSMVYLSTYLTGLKQHKEESMDDRCSKLK
jgi:hypothetical protein